MDIMKILFVFMPGITKPGPAVNIDIRYLTKKN
jgi:hypothetical protein